ncbi:MAG TPA: hypothetical protein VHE61_00525 [Opitutaceae bacterium]|nr:hypothetical protein [Opitutaceae bacterium]
MKARPLLLLAVLAACATVARAWDYEGHRLVNEVALSALPQDFPAFVHTRANAERIAFLAGEPDRWRNVPDLPLQQANGMNHYLDLEDIPAAGLDLATLPSFRYDFAVAFAAGRAAHPQNFPAIDEEKNYDHSRQWCGFLPWTVAEQFGKLRSAFSYLKVYEELGTKEEVENAERNVVYVMGVMGHYVGDSAQPLHTTIHHHGWVGPNPEGYTTWPGIHAWIDGGLIGKARIRLADLQPLVKPAEALSVAPRADRRDPVFVAELNYIVAQNRQVEPLYRLQKDGKLGDHDRPVTDEGKKFIEGQLVSGGEMLASIWLTAWQNTVPDEYLRNTLLRRQGRPVERRPRPTHAAK